MKPFKQTQKKIKRTISLQSLLIPQTGSVPWRQRKSLILFKLTTNLLVVLMNCSGVNTDTYYLAVNLIMIITATSRC